MYNDNDDNLGRVFERSFHKQLEYLCSKNYFDHVFTEDDLRKMYGWQSVSVDFLLIKSNYVIVVQTKYRKTRRREDHGIQNFIKSIEHVLGKAKDLKLAGGFWISRMKPFDDNISFLLSKNIQCIYHFDSMDILIKKSIDTIKQVVVD